MSISVDQWPECLRAGTTRFLWGGEDPSTVLGAGWQCLEERDSSGDLAARYTYAPGYIDDVAVQERDLNADDDFGDANEVVYYHQNTLFSVYALTDAGEDVVERYRYDAYGGCTVLDADGSADSDGASDVRNPYAFTGRRLDHESGLMQYRNRYYDPDLGRFVSRDLIDEQAAALHLYCADRPTWAADPMGEMPVVSAKGDMNPRLALCLLAVVTVYDVCTDVAHKNYRCCMDGAKKAGDLGRAWCDRHMTGPYSRAACYELVSIVEGKLEFACMKGYTATELLCGVALLAGVDYCLRRYGGDDTA